MKHRREVGSVIVLALIGLLVAAVVARSEDGLPAVEPSRTTSAAGLAATPELQELAAAAGVRVDDLLVRPSPPEGVAPEEFAASVRRRLDDLGPEAAVAAVAGLRRRLEWAAEHAARDPARPSLMPTSGPSAAVGPRVDDTPTPVTCERYCNFLARCNGSVEPGEHEVCVDVCERGSFGPENRLVVVLAGDSCQHP